MSLAWAAAVRRDAVRLVFRLTRQMRKNSVSALVALYAYR